MVSPYRVPAPCPDEAPQRPRRRQWRPRLRSLGLFGTSLSLSLLVHLLAVSFVAGASVSDIEELAPITVSDDTDFRYVRAEGYVPFTPPAPVRRCYQPAKWLGLPLIYIDNPYVLFSDYDERHLQRLWTVLEPADIDFNRRFGYGQRDETFMDCIEISTTLRGQPQGRVSLRVGHRTDGRVIAWSHPNDSGVDDPNLLCCLRESLAAWAVDLSETEMRSFDLVFEASGDYRIQASSPLGARTRGG